MSAVDGVDDVAEFAIVKKAMAFVGIGDAQQQAIFQVTKMTGKRCWFIIVTPA